MRYTLTGTTVVPGRGAFPQDYPIVPVAGAGAVLECPTPAAPGDVAALYAPCYGGSKGRGLKV